MKNEKKSVRRGRVYEIAPGAKNHELEGQAAVIVNVLKKKAATMSEIAAAAGKSLKTKQEPIRVVNHYIGKLRAAKVVRIAKAA